MKKNRYTIFVVIIYMLIFQGVVIGCNDEKDNKKNNGVGSNEVDRELTLESGAYIEKNGENYSIYNKNNLSILDTDRVVTNYNKKNHTYIFNHDEIFYVNFNGIDYKISDDMIYNPKISPNGEYVLFFTKDEFLVPKIFDIKENVVKDIGNKAVISGQYVDWIGNNIAFYGVDNEEKIAGIFEHDLESGKEKCMYVVKDGFVEYFNTIEDEVIFIERKYSKEALVKSINEHGDVKEIYADSEEVFDIEITDQGIFLLGKVKNNVYSLYKINNNTAQRLIYDFPMSISFEKGISKTEDGKILFIGSTVEGEEKIYIYSEESISDSGNSSGHFYFINVN